MRIPTTSTTLDTLIIVRIYLTQQKIMAEIGKYFSEAAALYWLTIEKDFHPIFPNSILLLLV